MSIINYASSIMNFRLNKIALAALAICSTMSAVAQNTGDLLRFSQYDFSNSTARSAAMAGAFTSLGSDLSSMSINPAGLGMYSASELAVTAGVNIGASRSDYSGSNNNLSSRVKVMIPQLGAAFKIGDFTLAFGFNRLSDFNSRMSATGNYEQFNSAARIWADQITGIPAGQFGKEYTMFRRNPLLWNGVMGYDSFLIDPAIANDPNNTTYGVWGIVNPDDKIQSQIDMTTNGSITEVALAGAWDFNKILYLGATMGFQNIRYEQSSIYRERNDLSNITANTGVLNDLSLRHNLTMIGFGFNLKLGATVRPVPWLRIGAAYHSPTWATIDERSNSELTPNLEDNTGRYTYTPELQQDYRFQTPGRVMVGASATIARMLVVSFDYEHTMYADMFYNSPLNLYGWREGVLPNDIDNLPNTSWHTAGNGNVDINAMVGESYRSTNNYRVGLEIQPVSRLFLRGGFAYSESPYKNIESYYAPGTNLSDYGAITRYSAGVGYRTGRFNIDAAYVYSSWSELPSKFFDYITVNPYDTGKGEIINAGTEIASKGNISRKRENHNILVTFSWRFM